MHITSPTKIASAGNLPKVIEEYIGRVNTESANISIARMVSPSGWEEPGQRPEFDEYTLVLKGRLRIENETGEVIVSAGQAYHAGRNQWVRYSSPFPEGAEYVAVCLPAFSPETVRRDGEPAPSARTHRPIG